MIYIVDFRSEALDEQALTVHIRKSERTYAFVHSPALAPVFYRAQQGTGNRYIIHEIEPAEANLLLVPLFVGTMVDNGSNSTYDTSLAVNRQEVLSLAEFKTGFFFGSSVFISSKRKKEWQTYGLCRDHNETE